MPLSEHEQQLLEQMEQALYAEDPKFASQMQGSGARAARRRLIVAIVGVVAGLVLVLVGVNTQQWWIGAVGFAVMVGSVAFAVTPPRRRAALGAVQADGSVRRSGAGARTGASRGNAARPKARKSFGSFMHRMEERWDRRRGQGF